MSPTAGGHQPSGRSRRHQDSLSQNPVFLKPSRRSRRTGANAVCQELYGALESKAVDGQENPFAVILSNKMFEVQKYVSATNHVYGTNIIPGQQALLGQALPCRAEDDAGRRQ